MLIDLLQMLLALATLFAGAGAMFLLLTRKAGKKRGLSDE